MAALLSSTDSELYAQYIFLENAFSLPSASGLPLKFSLTGVFAAGAKGGFSFSPGMVRYWKMYVKTGYTQQTFYHRVG